MTERGSPPRAVQDAAMADLLGKLESVLRDLQCACAGVEDNLGHTAIRSERLQSSAFEQIQELDRVTQTIGDLATLFASLGAGCREGNLDISAAVSQLKLDSVRGRLQGGVRLPTEGGDRHEIELF